MKKYEIKKKQKINRKMMNKNHEWKNSDKDQCKPLLILIDI